MSEQITVIEGGTVTSPMGFQAGATFAGMKTYREDKYDLGIVFSVSPCSCAGTFTRLSLIHISEPRD